METNTEITGNLVDLSIQIRHIPTSMNLHDIVELFEPFGIITHACLITRMVDNQLVFTGEANIQIKGPNGLQNRLLDEFKESISQPSTLKVTLTEVRYI
mmetsp:Transcript_26729/g.39695  ORF Transcript_26729/g.39695 Transcript_26729/m.39695 type:complete len:99 (+) Transcript_26729:132-428(+)